MIWKAKVRQVPPNEDTKTEKTWENRLNTGHNVANNENTGSNPPGRGEQNPGNQIKTMNAKWEARCNLQNKTGNKSNFHPLSCNVVAAALTAPFGRSHFWFRAFAGSWCNFVIAINSFIIFWQFLNSAPAVTPDNKCCERTMKKNGSYTARSATKILCLLVNV